MKRAFKCWLAAQSEESAQLVEAVDAVFAAEKFVEQANDAAGGDLLIPDESDSIVVRVQGPSNRTASFKVTGSCEVVYLAEELDAAGEGSGAS